VQVENDIGADMIQTKIGIPMDKIIAFCQKWKIKEFSLFGSVLRDDFRPDSDVDVMVSFEERAGWDLSDWVDMIEELKVIFGRDVDLVEKGTIRNPFRRHSIMKTKEVLYAA
jgi:uncharacterized protein